MLPGVSIVMRMRESLGWERHLDCGKNLTCFREENNVMGIRIEEHPILGVQEKGKLIKFTFDGKEVEGYEGEPIAAALKAAGLMVHRYTKKEHKPRGIFCAIGRCTDCVMVVDGISNVRTCITPLKEGMVVKTQYGVTDIPFEDIKKAKENDG
jgi:hypothetical protein